MPRSFGQLIVCAALSAAAVLAQTKPVFEVATIKPSPPLDMVKLAADIRAGHMPKMGAHIDASRAEYTFLVLRDLIVLAYGVKPNQVSGPPWLTTQRFDILAKLPENTRKEQVPGMLQALLEERFKLKVHRETAEHPVLGLVVGKGGPKLKESAQTPSPIDQSIPLKEGEMETEGPDGPVRTQIGKDGSAVINMGSKGKMSYKMDPATQSFHLEGEMISMSGFADMLTQFSQMGGSGGKRIVDMTGLKGNYQVSIDFSIAELIQMARAAGMDIPGGPGAPAAPGGNPAESASDPSGSSSSVLTAVQSLGLKFEPRKAMIEQLIVDSMEKTPTDN